MNILNNLDALLQVVATHKAELDKALNALIDKSFMQRTDDPTLKDEVQDVEKTNENIGEIMGAMQSATEGIYNVIWGELQPPLGRRLQELKHRYLLEETDTPEESIEHMEDVIRTANLTEDERGRLIASLLFFLTTVESDYTTTVQEEQVDREVPFKERVVLDENLDAGLTEVDAEGVAGVDSVLYEITYFKDIELVRKAVSRERTLEPVTRVVRVGIRSTSPIDPEDELPEVPEPELPEEDEEGEV